LKHEICSRETDYRTPEGIGGIDAIAKDIRDLALLLIFMISPEADLSVIRDVNFYAENTHSDVKKTWLARAMPMVAGKLIAFLADQVFVPASQTCTALTFMQAVGNIDSEIFAGSFASKFQCGDWAVVLPNEQNQYVLQTTDSYRLVKAEARDNANQEFGNEVIAVKIGDPSTNMLLGNGLAREHFHDPRFIAVLVRKQ
jgi:hypothetical protein